MEGMKRTDPRHLAEQRRKILETAARSIAEHGYYGMSMRALARATGKSLATAYNYFSSKEEILFALQKEAFETLISAAERALAGVESPSSRLYVLILNHLTYVSTHADVMRVLVHEAGSLPPQRRRSIRALKKRYFEIGRGVIEELLAEGCGSAGVPGGQVDDPVEVERVTYSLFGMLNWVYSWYSPERHGEPRELARSMHGLIVCGALTRCPVREMQTEMDSHFGALEPRPLIRGREPAAREA